MKDNQAYITKEESVLQYIRLGMDFHTSCLASMLTEDEEDILSEDEAFLRQIDIEGAQLERGLLTRHDTASRKAEVRGGTSALQWKLEKINPGRYSGKDKDSGMFNGKVSINVVRGGSADEDLKIIHECPECTSRNIGQSQKNKSIWCKDCKHKVEDREVDKSFERYEVKHKIDK